MQRTNGLDEGPLVVILTSLFNIKITFFIIETSRSASPRKKMDFTRNDHTCLLHHTPGIQPYNRMTGKDIYKWLILVIS